MHDRLTRIQLAIFAVITAITLTVMAIFYLRLPATFGIGTYGVSADFVAGGGLYKNANVTYRGVAVGRVESVGLSPNGVIAQMRLNSETAIPSNVTATVKSVSAVGEQYIDLVPPSSPASSKLTNGARIERQNTRIGQDVADLLKRAETLVNSLGDTRLRELLHETFIAANGSGPELARLFESARLLVDEANANYPQVSQLIDQAGPFLQAQIRAGGDIKSLSDGLARFTSEVRQADPQLRDTLATAPGATDEASTAFSGIRPNFPTLAASLANLGRVGVIYNKSIEQLLVVLPALFAAITTAAGGGPQDEGAKLDFKLDLNDPPPCAVGFLPPPLMRTPADETVRELPRDMYCKTAQNDPSTVRGARNYPCQEFPGKRAPTIQLCRDPKGYVPIGRNPWRGPPVPYDTPMTNGLNVLPPNHFPYVPPDADPDPGTPMVGPPRRVWSLDPVRRRTSRPSPRRRPTTTGRRRRSRRGSRRGCRRCRRSFRIRSGCPRARRRWGSTRRRRAPDRRSRGARRPAGSRRPAGRRMPPMTRRPARLSIRQEALVSSPPAPPEPPAPRIGWTSCLIQGLCNGRCHNRRTDNQAARSS
ncbi:mce related family protein [Mycobacterium intracellulare 1956]|uniref:Mce related family protein n=1 Tax=Mycobacterium intracellulare 1956 TaxID=1299331 RepID=X8CPL0_MYCIT|nr:mce related family protein [Mycobacterium intracellulare 1956]